MASKQLRDGGDCHQCLGGGKTTRQALEICASSSKAARKGSDDKFRSHFVELIEVTYSSIGRSTVSRLLRSPKALVTEP